MTIKMVETFNRTKGHLFWKRPHIEIRESVLEPDAELTFYRVTWDEDGRGNYEGDVRIKVITPDSLEFQQLSSHHVPPHDFKNPTEADVQKYSLRTLEKEDIRYVIDKAWGGKATGSEGQDINIYWEPTLSPLAKK